MENENVENVAQVVNNKCKWYALYVQPNNERKVRDALVRQVSENNLTDYIPNIEVPMEKYWAVIRDKKQVREKVMIPGYILVQADLTNGEVIPTIKSVKGVFNFVKAEKNSQTAKPSPLSQRDVDKFLNTVQETATEIKYTYDIGDEVQVLEGPFSGFVGTIESKDDQTKKMKVSVNIFGRPTPLELEYHQVSHQKTQ